MEMTHAEVVRLCKAAGFYSTPDLNEKLYLQCKGFCEIGGLEEFVNARALWLEGNCIDEIKGLDRNTELMCLYMARNMVCKMENLGHLKKLRKLDLSNNMIRAVEGVEGCEVLSELNLSKNNIRTKNDLKGLLARPTITTLDLSHNSIESGDDLFATLVQCPQILSLRLMGNPAVRSIPCYRNKMIAALPHLCSLDDTPVTAVDREAAVAFVNDGPEAEREVRTAARNKEREKQEKQLKYFDDLIQEARKKRGTPQPHTEYYRANVQERTGQQEVSGRSLAAEVEEIFDTNTYRAVASSSVPAPASPPSSDAGSDWSATDSDSSNGSEADYNDLHKKNASRESAWAQGKQHTDPAPKSPIGSNATLKYTDPSAIGCK
eukprot:TRINITY_DN9007_c0_g1_i1.p1 TRINITY_DN9007_c0_g1~~TRINITY_DN9007_c0_g1_i1.p1  ORF type:complete len:391 (+),score=113.26 TRINITY_DN9007_c0_g1_i1:44-1174(+)